MGAPRPRCAPLMARKPEPPDAWPAAVPAGYARRVTGHVRRCAWARLLEPAVRRPGEVVRAARLRSGLTLAELGNRTGYSAAQVSRYERGVTPLRDVSVLRRFARA